jgi:hypothetical protein
MSIATLPPFVARDWGKARPSTAFENEEVAA